MSVVRQVIKIGTHNGCFHCDEALACYMLKKLPEYSKAEIIRSRDEKDLNSCNIVVDVGGIYDPTNHKYDHHQSTFQETLSSLRPNLSSNIRLSSAGLVYHHFGERVLEAVAGKKLETHVLSKLFKYVYFHLIQEVDAIDNGVPMHEVGEPLYSIHTHLSARVSRLHPGWNEKTTSNEDQLFEKAMDLTGSEFEYTVNKFFSSWWPARSIVEDAINNRFKTHESGEIIELEFCPWKSHLFDIEKEQEVEGSIKFVLFENQGSWRVAAVPKTLGSFMLRVPIEWRGLRNEDLQNKSGVADAVFVHATGFIGGAASKEGAMKLAEETLKINKEAK